MTWGDKADWMIKCSIEAGLPPPSTAIMPELDDYLTSIWNLFLILNGTRKYGEVAGNPFPLTFTEIKSYFDLADTEIPDGPIHETVTLIKTLDIQFLTKKRK